MTLPGLTDSPLRPLRFSPLAVLLCLALPSLGFGQDAPLALKGCRNNAMLGPVRSAGSIAVQVDSRGRADTRSIIVTNVESGTAAGLQSAVRRQLVTCSFRVKQEKDTAAWYLFNVTWNTKGLVIAQPVLLDAPPPVLFPSAPDDIPDELSLGDARLEEAPRIIECRLQPTGAVTVRTPSGQAVAKAKAGSPARIRGATLEYVVTPEGRVDLATFTLVAGDPGDALKYAERLAGCAFLPGRVGGVPVRTRKTSAIPTPTEYWAAQYDGPEYPFRSPELTPNADSPRVCGITAGCIPNQN